MLFRINLVKFLLVSIIVRFTFYTRKVFRKYAVRSKYETDKSKQFYSERVTLQIDKVKLS